MRDRVLKTAVATAGFRRRVLRVLVRFVAIAAVAYVIGFEPIVPFYPVCWEEGSEGPVRHTLYGGMTDEFAEAMNFQHFREQRTRRVCNVIFMTLNDWIFGFWYPYSVMANAISYIITVRHGIDTQEIFQRRVRLPEFDRRWPTCEAVRSIAFVGGKWSREGPSPIWYKRAGMPRPVGFVDAQVPGWADGEPGGSMGEFVFACLLVAFTFGAAAGYLLAVWRERNMLRYISIGGLCASIFALAAPVIYYIIGYLAYETPLRVLLGL